MKNEIQATTVRTLLSLLLILAIAGCSVGFYFGLLQVKDMAVSVTHASEDASAGSTQVTELQALETRLEKTRLLVEKADTMFATPETYQGQVLADLKTYATAAGITIANTDFSETENNKSPYANTRPVTITLAQPVSYTALLRFLELTEGGLPKITVNGLKITRPSPTTGDRITVDPINMRISVQ